MSKKRGIFGPATLVTAAFVGPGTLTACTLAGMSFGHSLVWALVLATIIAILFQEMAGRVGLVRGMGLAETLRHDLANPVLKYFTLGLVFVAIIAGNAAYEAGNITGASKGIAMLTSQFDLWPPVIGVFAAIVLWTGNYKIIERLLIALVVLMSLVFVITGLLTLFSTGWVNGKENIEPDAWLIVVALIGTTVVPYNLFLHSSTVKERYEGAKEMSQMRRETWVSIGLGGLVSICILFTGVGGFEVGERPASLFSFADPMVNLLGNWSIYVWAIGFGAAGLTSAITAPLAAAFVANELFGQKSGMKSWLFRLTWFIILAIGVLFAMTDLDPVYVIKMAQVANGIILPFMAILLLWIVNRRSMNEHRNTLITNIIGGVIVTITLILGFKSLNSVFHFV